MIGVIIIIIAACLFLALAVVFFFGKGSWLIAGYNTMSKTERDKYDTKKLCRAVSIICAVTSVMLGVMAFLGYRVETGVMDENAMLPFGILFAIIIILSIVVASVYINKKAKK